jgi:hypothetical protein
MGHATASIYLAASDLVSTRPNDILHAGIAEWSDTLSDRHDSPEPGYVTMRELNSREAAGYSIGPDDVHSGASVVVPVTTSTITKTRNVKHTVTAEELKLLRRGVVYPYFDKQTFGPHVTKIEVVALPKVRAPKAEATEGASVTKYVVIGAGSVYATGNTQAEARAKAIELMKNKENISSLSIEARITRADGNPALVRITRPEPETSTVTLRVKTVEPKPGAKTEGYLVAFSYHC